MINEFVTTHKVDTVIEFGAGDGNQLSLLHLPHYVGVDVSSTAIAMLCQRFAGDRTKQFVLAGPEAGDAPGTWEQADLAMSLDVIYHLIENQVFERYMRDLFGAAKRYVIIYSSNSEAPQPAPHVRHRRFTDYVAAHFPDWQLMRTMENPYRQESFADFFFYERQGSVRL